MVAVSATSVGAVRRFLYRHLELRLLGRFLVLPLGPLLGFLLLAVALGLLPLALCE
jgi:hypothetical protein